MLTSAQLPLEEDRPAALLELALRHAPLIHRLQEILWDRPHLKLAALISELWGTADEQSEKATVTLLQLAASARPRVGAYPLVPHRLHLLVRPTSGLTVCLDPGCSGTQDRHLSPLGSVSVGTTDTCTACGGGVLSLLRCVNCGEWVLAGETVQDRGKERYRPIKVTGQNYDLLTPKTHAIPGATLITVGPDGTRGSRRARHCRGPD